MALRKFQGQAKESIHRSWSGPVKVTGTRDILTSASANFLVQDTFRISYINFGNLKKGKKVITPKLNGLYFKKLNTG